MTTSKRSATDHRKGRREEEEDEGTYAEELVGEHSNPVRDNGRGKCNHNEQQERRRLSSGSTASYLTFMVVVEGRLEARGGEQGVRYRGTLQQADEGDRKRGNAASYYLKG